MKGEVPRSEEGGNEEEGIKSSSGMGELPLSTKFLSGDDSLKDVGLLRENSLGGLVAIPYRSSIPKSSGKSTRCSTGGVPG